MLPDAISTRGAPPRDRFVGTYVAPTLLYFLLIVFGGELDRAFNLSFYLVPLILIPGAILLLWLLACLLINAFRRCWRRTASVFLSPLVAVAPLILLGRIGVTPTWLIFRFQKAGYEQQIAQSAQTPGVPRLRAFHWGETGGAGQPNMFFTLVYDESDEIVLDWFRRSSSWRKRAERDDRLQSIQEERGSPNVQPLGQHFYMITEYY